MLPNPQLLLVAGPNGAGKSTFSKKLSAPGTIIFDVDKVIARIVAHFPAIPKKQVYQAATEDFLKQSTAAIRNRQHFTLETNFRDESPLAVVYLTLDNMEQSVARVNQRVLNGGHFVDHKNIKENYEIGLQYLEQYADRFDNLEIVSATATGFELRSLLSIQHKKLKHLSNVVPDQLTTTINAIASRFNPAAPEQDQNPGLNKGPRR
jgi:predicted ABC-type ATPase